MKRKAEYDARHSKKKSKTGATSSSSAALTPTAAASASSSSLSSSSTSSAASSKKSRLSSEEKAQHRDVSLYLNKQRTLVLSSRGIGYRDRHLLHDLLDLLPHGKKDSKLDTKHGLDVLNELAMLKQCNNVLYLESRKHSDLYLWLSRAAVGPSVKCLLQAVHTMSEVKLTGNCLKHSRPLLVWDAAFDSAPPLAAAQVAAASVLGQPQGSSQGQALRGPRAGFLHTGRQSVDSALPDRAWRRGRRLLVLVLASAAGGDRAKARAAADPHLQRQLRGRHAVGERGVRQPQRAESADEGSERQRVREAQGGDAEHQSAQERGAAARQRDRLCLRR